MVTFLRQLLSLVLALTFVFPTLTFVFPNATSAAEKDPLECMADRLDRELEGNPIKEADLISGEKIKVGETVWMRWNCKSCGFKGNTMEPNVEFRNVACGKCGHAHTDEIPYIMDENGNPIPMETAFLNGEKVEVASDKNSVVSEHDKVGGKDLDDNLHIRQGKKWQCPHCKASNFGKDYTCSTCAALRDDVPTPVTVERVPYLRDPKNRMKVAVAGGVVVAVAVVGKLIHFAVSTKDFPGAVEKTTWEQRSVVETFSLTKKRDWRENLSQRNPTMPVNGRGEDPGEFNIRNCSKEYFGDEEYQDGYKTIYEDVYDDVPYPSTEDVYDTETYDDEAWVSNGDGTATKTTVQKTRTVKTGTKPVTKYHREKVGTKPVQVPNMKTRPVYKQKCDYDTYEWRHKDSNRTSGVNPQPGSDGQLHLDWPRMNAGRHDREIRSTNYQVYYSFLDGKKRTSKNFSVASPDELIPWTKGAELVVTRNSMGGIVKVSHKPKK